MPVQTNQWSLTRLARPQRLGVQVGVHREIERMLARPADAVLVREIISFWSNHKQVQISADGVAASLHRPLAHVGTLLGELANAGVLTQQRDGLSILFSYRLAGTDAFKVEQFARSRDFHEQRLVRSTDKFRNLYQRRSSK